MSPIKKVPQNSEVGQLVLVQWSEDQFDVVRVTEIVAENLSEEAALKLVGNNEPYIVVSDDEDETVD